MPMRSRFRIASLAALLVCGWLAVPAPTAHADATVSYTAADSSTQTIYGSNSEGQITVNFTIDGGSGSASLVIGTPQTLTIGSSGLDVQADEDSINDTGLTISRQFTVGGVTHALIQIDDLSGEVLNGNPGQDATADVHAGPTVTFDLGTTGQVDVTPQEYVYDLVNDPTPPGYQYTLLLRAPASPPASITAAPAAVTYPDSATGTVTLSSPAPAGGETVALASSDPTVTVPAMVPVAAGATSVTFPITTSRVDVNTPVTLTAMAEQQSTSTIFTVLTRPETTFAYSLADLPNQQYTGSNATLDFSITGGSGSVGLALGIPYTIDIGSYNLTPNLYDLDSYVAVYNLSFSRSFTVGVVVDSLDQKAGSIRASIDDYDDFEYFADIPAPDPDPLVYHLGNKGIVTVSAPGLNENYPPLITPIPVTFTLMPTYPVVLALAVNPYKLYGGATTCGRVRLDAHAPSGGIVVTLTSSNPDVASVPASVTVPAGALSATFPITTYAQDADDTASITAQSGGYSAKTHLDVLALYALSGTIVDHTGAALPGVTVTATTDGTFLLTSTATPNILIPDGNAAGVKSTIVPSATGVINGISVGLDITHPKIGDLKITLTGPDGTSVILQNPSDSTQQNLTASYPILTTPVQRLTTFIDKPIQGTWTLKVVDAKTGNVGILNDWSLTFDYNGPFSSSAVTAADGTYTVSGLKEDLGRFSYGRATYIVSPMLTGYAFSPSMPYVEVGPGASPPNPDGIDFTSQP